MINKINKYLKKNFIISKSLKTYLKNNTFNQKIDLNPKKIIVDLTVDQPNYLLGNLILAKYLQSLNKYNIIGLIPHYFCFKTKKIAKSFSIDNFEYIDKRYISYKYKNINIKDKPPKNIEEYINFEYNGIKVGDLIYDTYLRSSGNGTVDSIKDLDEYFLLMTKYYHHYRKMIERYDVKYFITGHIIYLTYGVLARLLLKNEGKVLSRKYSGNPFTIRLYTDYKEIFSYEYKFSKEEFKNFKKYNYKVKIDKGREYLQNRLNLIGKETDLNVLEAYDSNKQNFSYDELISLCAFTNKNPIIVIMCHVLPDAPHSNEQMIYSDYYTWFNAVLNIVKDITDTNWLIKPHPSNKYFQNKDSNVLLYESKFKDYRHIALTPDNINSKCLFDHAHAIVTCNGSAGLEYAAMGKPVISGGDTPYSGHGFIREPNTHLELKHELININNLKSLSFDKQNDALAYICLHYIDSRIKCIFLPNTSSSFWGKIDENTFWEEANNNLNKFTLEDDPLYNNFLTQMESMNPHILHIWKS